MKEMRPRRPGIDQAKVEQLLTAVGRMSDPAAPQFTNHQTELIGGVCSTTPLSYELGGPSGAQEWEIQKVKGDEDVDRPTGGGEMASPVDERG